MPIYMKVDSIPGDCSDKGFEGWHKLITLGWGEKMVITGSSGSQIGKLVVNDVVVTKLTGKGSPAFMLACATNRHIPTPIQIVVTLPSNQANPPINRFTLTDATVTGFQFDDDAASRPTETISLNFKGLQFDAFLNRDDGSHSTETASIQD